MNRVISNLLCLLGFHSYRQRINGIGTQLVCMREGCTHVKVFYAAKDGKEVIWSEKKIPVRHHSFKKKVQQ